MPFVRDSALDRSPVDLYIGGATIASGYLYTAQGNRNDSHAYNEGDFSRAEARDIDLAMLSLSGGYNSIATCAGYLWFVDPGVFFPNQVRGFARCYRAGTGAREAGRDLRNPEPDIGFASFSNLRDTFWLVNFFNGDTFAYGVDGLTRSAQDFNVGILGEVSVAAGTQNSSHLYVAFESGNVYAWRHDTVIPVRDPSEDFSLGAPFMSTSAYGVSIDTNGVFWAFFGSTAYAYPPQTILELSGTTVFRRPVFRGFVDVKFPINIQGSLRSRRPEIMGRAETRHSSLVRGAWVPPRADMNGFVRVVSPPPGSRIRSVGNLGQHSDIGNELLWANVVEASVDPRFLDGEPEGHVNLVILSAELFYLYIGPTPEDLFSSGPELNAEFRAEGRITIQVGGFSVEFMGIVGDETEPYIWSHGMNAEVGVFINNVAGLTDEATITLELGTGIEVGGTFLARRPEFSGRLRVSPATDVRGPMGVSRALMSGGLRILLGTRARGMLASRRPRWGGAVRVSLGVSVHGSLVGRRISFRAAAIYLRIRSRIVGEVPFQKSIWTGQVQVADPFANQPPVANAGLNQVVNGREIVQLNGSGSFDPDGIIQEYFWAQTAGPGVTLSSRYVARPTFEAPASDSRAFLSFSLRVTDNRGARATGVVNVEVVPQPPIIPGVVRSAAEIYVRSEMDQRRLWPTPIQWSNGFRETYRYQTEVIKARRGNEQRIAQRGRPRKGYDFQFFMGDLGRQVSIRRLASEQSSPYYFPHPRDVYRLPADVVSGALAISIAEAPPWLVEGEHVILESRGLRELVLLTTVSPIRAETSVPVAGNYRVGSKLSRAIFARMTQATVVSPMTSRAGTGQITIEEDALTAWHDPILESIPSSVSMIEGLEHFELSPQWANGVQITFNQQKEDLDLGHGIRDAYSSVPYTDRSLRLNYLLRNKEGIESLLGLFYRHRGQQKSFFVSSPVDEIYPAQSIAAGDSTVFIDGREFYDAFQGQRIYTYLMIRTPSGKVIRKVTGMELNDLDDTVVNLEAAIPEAISLEEIEFMTWIFKVRLASDLLTLQWATTEVATTTAVFNALEEEG